MKYRNVSILILFLILILALPIFKYLNHNDGNELTIIDKNSDLNSKISGWMPNGTAVCLAYYPQSYPQLCGDTGDGAYIIWEDFRSTIDRDIYIRRIIGSGYPSGVNNGTVVCNATGNQYHPQICTDMRTGGAVVTWHDYRSGTNYDIYSQLMSAAGIGQWKLNGVVICNASNDQLEPQIISDGAGGAIITWQDYRSGNWDIYAQRVGWDGFVQWTANGVAICNAANAQEKPQICSDGLGGAFITWQDRRNGTFYDIYAQRINSAGTAQWVANGIAVSNANQDQLYPQICSDEYSGAIIVWVDFRNGADLDVYTQRVSSSGSTIWAANGLAVCTATNFQFNAQLCSDESGGAIITWEDYRSGSNYDIYAQEIRSSGYAAWTVNGVAICNAIYDQLIPQICSDDARGAYITWLDLRSSSYDIYAQRIDNYAQIKWNTNGIAISTADDYQDSPQICSNSQGGAIITWHDRRSGVSYDIYAQLVNPTGTPDFLVVAPIALSAHPHDWSPINSFNITWNNPFDPSGYMGAYYKLDSPPTSNTDGTYVNGMNIWSITGITVSGNGAHDIYIWLKDGESNVNFHKYATTTLYFDNSIFAPIGLSATPSSGTTVNSFNISWINPSDLSGIVGAYFKLDTPPTSQTDGFYVAGENITTINHIWVSGYGAHAVFVWLKDTAGNVDFSQYNSTILTLSEPPSEPIPFPLPLIQFLALTIIIVGISRFKRKSNFKL